MKTILLLKNIESKIVLTRYFKNEDDAINWWASFIASEEWIIIYGNDRERSGHRYEITYSKFDERGELYSRYAICYSKKESLILEKKIHEANPKYITAIKKLY